jgi:putative ABC transport system permease protein
MRAPRSARNVRLGVKSLLLHKLRSLLTTLGIVFGVSSVIAMLSVGEGASREAIQQIRKLGSNNILLASVKPLAEEPGAAVQRESHMTIYGIKRDDEKRIRETLPAVVRTVPVRLLRKTARAGTLAAEMRIVATTADWFNLVRRDVLAGRVLQARDLAENAAVCVLTESGARRLLAGGPTLGTALVLGDEPFTVVGVVRSEGDATAAQIPDREIDIYVPITTALERYGEIVSERASGTRSIELVELHRLLVEVSNLDRVETVAGAIRSMLRRFHSRDDVDVSVPLSLLRQAEDTKRRFNIVLGAIAGISLLVGGIGIMNIMLATVTERTREIGIRRALGARRAQIVQQFLTETVVLSGAGGILGTLLGLLVPFVITRLTGMPTVIAWYGVALALFISLGVGLLFGLYPAVRAARLDPIEALRHE